MSKRIGLFVLLMIFGLLSTSTQDVLSNFIFGAPEGVPGVDYPEYTAVPRRNSFTCRDRKPGFYADPDTRCQVWFWCDTFLIKHSFLCPNLTVFNQKIRGCDWWYNVDCSLATSQYVNNDELYLETPAEKARESARKQKELIDRQRDWNNRPLPNDGAVFVEDGTSVSSLNDADNDLGFTSTLDPDLIFSPTTTFTPSLPPLTRRPVTFAPTTRPPATLPPATLPPATLSPATLPPATLPPATLPPATLPPATHPPATRPTIIRQPITSPQWVPAIPIQAVTQRTIVPAQARPPAPFFFRPIANAIPINFPTPPRTRRPPTTPLPLVTDITQPLLVVSSPASGLLHHQQQQDFNVQTTSQVLPITSVPTVTVSGRRRRPSTVPPTTAADLNDQSGIGLQTGSESPDFLDVTQPVFGTTLDLVSHGRLPQESTSDVTNQFPSFPTSDTPLRVRASLVTTIAPVTAPPTTRVPPSTVTSTLDDITTQSFDPAVAFGSRLEGEPSENVAQFIELQPTTEASRRRKFIDGSGPNVQTFPPFPTAAPTQAPKKTITKKMLTTLIPAQSRSPAIFNSRRGAIKNVTESSVPIKGEEDVEDFTASTTFASTRIAVPPTTTSTPIKAQIITAKPVRTFPTFPITTFKPPTDSDFGQRDGDNLNEVTDAATISSAI